MSRDFYELKYNVLEVFYNILSGGNYSYGQAASRTYDEFHRTINDNGIESVIVYITIGTRLLKHQAVSEYHLNYIKEAISLYESLDVESSLDDDENNVLFGEISNLIMELGIY